MNSNQNRINELSDAYWSATITEDQQRELQKLLNKEQQLDKEQQALKIMLSGFEALSKEFETESIAPAKPKRQTKIIKLVASFSAVAAAAVITFGVITTEKNAPEPEIYCYINGEPITDINIAMEQTKYFEPIADLSQTINALESIMLN